MEIGEFLVFQLSGYGLWFCCDYFDDGLSTDCPSTVVCFGSAFVYLMTLLFTSDGLSPWLTNLVDLWF